MVSENEGGVCVKLLRTFDGEAVEARGEAGEAGGVVDVDEDWVLTDNAVVLVEMVPFCRVS